ncbi:MAG: RsiV family protein [Acinetobacter sp.]
MKIQYPTKTFSLVVISIALFLSACQKQPEEQRENKASQPESQVASQPAQPEFTVQVVNVAVNLPACEGNNCPEFQVKRLKSNVPELDALIDQKILNTLKNSLDLATLSDTTASSVNASEVDASQVVVSKNTATDAFTQNVQQYADTFVGLDKELKTMNANPQISLHIQPKVLQQQGDIVTIQLNSDNFLGGAHGSAAQQYFSFDTKQKKLIQLDDVLQKGQKAALSKVAHAQFEKWVIEQKLASNIKEYEDAWPFKLSQNFYFNKQGLVLQYAEYEIGPYVVGQPSFTIPYSALQGIVKAHYLPAQS